MRVPGSLDARARQQLTDLVAGVTRWRRWLDFVIDQFATRKTASLDPPLRQILRLAVYEMTQRGQPPHAVVNEYVALARPRTRGFANAVLRRVSENLACLPEPSMPDPAEQMAVRFSHPTWMVRRWLDRFGAEEAEQLLHWNNSPPRFGVRINLHQTSRQSVTQSLEEAGTDWLASPFLDDFVRVESVRPLLESGMLERGQVHVQDESAGLVVRVLDPQSGETVVDLCAAPGGKLIYACSRMRDRGSLIAVDANRARLKLAQRSARSSGCSIARFVAADATDLPSDVGSISADRVLLDAPCSGLGVMSRRPDLRWRRGVEDVSGLSDLQDRLLDAAAGIVRPGGRLVYSTCTIEPEENEQRIDAFLRRNSQFEIEPVRSLVPADMVTSSGFFASLPQRHGIDGAFAARLRRTR